MERGVLAQYMLGAQDLVANSLAQSLGSNCVNSTSWSEIKAHQGISDATF